ncbi:TolB family protein [Dyella amyloliquefaciens]|uniref:TolB family protein n=1 Tax=Dyella amyloliquefaciens TaxID=1770545 RepID=UPI0013EE6C10|nr:PD40 domain-containing protein [Dyella amyloliquefaciens]
MIRQALSCMLALAATSAWAVDTAPAVFAPGVISGPQHDSAPAFAPDGHTVYFSRSDGPHSTILVSHESDGRWSTPTTAPFSGHWSDMEPSMSPDGRQLVFISNRPRTPGGKPLDGYFMGRRFPEGGGNLWVARREGDGWSAPVRLPDIVNASDSTFAPSIAADGTLYFMRPADDPKHFRLFRAACIKGIYQKPEPLPFSDGTTTDVDPAVAPDQSFLVFGSSRAPAQQIDLFIVFRDGGRWGTPKHLGNEVNSAGSDAEARLSPDHRTLYFASDRLSNSPPGAARADWDNGKYNIWDVSLVPWLDAHAGKAPAGSH